MKLQLKSMDAMVEENIDLNKTTFYLIMLGAGRSILVACECKSLGAPFLSTAAAPPALNTQTAKKEDGKPQIPKCYIYMNIYTVFQILKG